MVSYGTYKMGTEPTLQILPDRPGGMSTLNAWIHNNYTKFLATFSNTSLFLFLVGWWRRAESNRRPEMLNISVYKFGQCFILLIAPTGRLA